jgi:hypothetical protein
VCIASLGTTIDPSTEPTLAPSEAGLRYTVSISTGNVDVLDSVANTS